jgi:hypothetical protein
MAAGRSIKTPGANVSDLEKSSGDRLDDSRTLIVAGRSATAIAAGIYALEIHLKVLICKHLDILHLPRAFEIHDLEELLILTGLSRKLESHPDNQLLRNWADIVGLSTKLNDLRYSPGSNWPIHQAEAFMIWLDDPDHGVLTWLTTGP